MVKILKELSTEFFLDGYNACSYKKHSCVDEKANITCFYIRTKLDYLHAKRVEWIIDRFQW